MNPTEALSTLRASLPANPGNDGPAGVDSAALRVLLDAEPRGHVNVAAIDDRGPVYVSTEAGHDSAGCIYCNPRPGPAPDTEGAARGRASDT